MASLGRFLTKLPKQGQIHGSRTMGTKTAQATDSTSDSKPHSAGGINFVLTDTQKEVFDIFLVKCFSSTCNPIKVLRNGGEIHTRGSYSCRPHV